MTGKSSSDANDWTSMWADAQQKYWQSWLDLSQKAAEGMAGKAPEPPPNPWAQSFDYWAKLMPGAAPAESRDWIGKMADLNKGYLQMGEGLWKMLSAGQGQGQPQSAQAWWDTVNQGFKAMQDQFAGQIGGAKDPWAGFATFWGMPIDNWRRVCSACSVMPGDMEKALRGFAEVGSPESALDRWFSLPTLGYNREGQEEMQRLGQLWIEHSQALREYATDVLSKVTAKATELLTAKLQELASQGKTPDTLRDFYNLWVDCGEEAYATEAYTPEFTRAQARLVNTLLAAKRQEQKMVDEFLGSLNMPTRRELDTSHKRIHQLQRQVWKLREELDESGVSALRDEVATLRREMEALRAESDSAKSEKRANSRAAKTNP